MTGKRTVAVALGKFLEKGEFVPPAEGEVLQDSSIINLAFMRARDPDARGDSIGIDAVREAKHFLWQRPNASPRRTLVIDDADLLTIEAQNALLKITEEPPNSSLLILVTADPDALLPTILSRLPKISFGTVPAQDIASWLAGKERGDAAISGAQAKTFAARALGKPGLAWRLAHDPVFRARLDDAECFLKTTSATRKEFIKKLIESDDFVMREFLDAVITVLAWQEPSKGKAELWHRTLRLAENADAHPLNPRLQLEALMR
jgi:DNA polymerase-3 subunit delta'